MLSIKTASSGQASEITEILQLLAKCLHSFTPTSKKSQPNHHPPSLSPTVYDVTKNISLCSMIIFFQSILNFIPLHELLTQNAQTCNPTHSNVVSRKALNGLNGKNISFEGFLKAQDSYNIFFSFKRTFALKIPVQMFAYFISKVPCNTNQSLQVHDEKNCFSDTTAPFGTREDRKIIFYVLTLSLPRERVIYPYN